MPHEAPVLALAFSDDGKLLATGCADGIARVWRMDGEKIAMAQTDWQSKRCKALAQ